MASKKSDSLEEMAISFLGCRDKGHHWLHLTDKVTSGTRRQIREVSRWWSCSGCTCEMTEVIEIPSCDVLSRKYLYPDGYLLVSGVIAGRRVNVRDIRREVFSRSGIQF